MTRKLLILAVLLRCVDSFSSMSSWKPSGEINRDVQHTTETLGTIGFHHVEFYCGDAASAVHRFCRGLGLKLVGSSGQHTGNPLCISYGVESNNMRFLLTAPYSLLQSQDGDQDDAQSHALPGFDKKFAHDFFTRHGMAVRAVAVEVDDIQHAFAQAVANGAKTTLAPTTITPTSTTQVAEIELYGDVVLRLIQQDPSDTVFLPNLQDTSSHVLSEQSSYGLQRFDHAVGNVPDLQQSLEYISRFSGFHEFAEFTPEQVGTIESGLNSVVLASDGENVLLPINEPTEGKRKSQIQTFLEQNEGSGLQHLALKTDDIFATIQSIQAAGVFELMTRPSDEYYRTLPDHLGDKLSESQYHELESLGILADADEEGVLLQVFTKPIGDRPTFFFEIIQRIGCRIERQGEEKLEVYEKPGCGGFGQGNFRELFKAIEEHEKTLSV